MGLTASYHARFFSPAYKIADRLIAFSLAALLLLASAATIEILGGEIFRRTASHVIWSLAVAILLLHQN